MNRKTLGFMWWTVVSLVSIALFIRYNFSEWTYFVASILILPGMLFLFTIHKTSWVYRNRVYNFQLTLPPGWDKGLFENPSNLTFYGPHRECLKIAIGPISPVPDVEMQQNDLGRIATKCGHTILEVGTIHVCGKDHATIRVEIPKLGTRKNYSLIFDDIEYLLSANVEIADSIVQSFKFYHDFKRLDRFYAKHNLR